MTPTERFGRLVARFFTYRQVLWARRVLRVVFYGLVVAYVVVLVTR